MIFKSIITLILILLIIILIRKYVKAYRIYYSEKEKLFDFLLMKDDYEALKSLGAINPFGVRETWHIPSRKIRKYLAVRTDLIKEAVVIRFLKALDSFDKSYISYFGFSVLLIFILFFLYT